MPTVDRNFAVFVPDTIFCVGEYVPTPFVKPRVKNERFGSPGNAPAPTDPPVTRPSSPKPALPLTGYPILINVLADGSTVETVIVFPLIIAGLS